MNHFKKISQKLAEGKLDAVMLTAEPNRLYASGFRSSAGMVLVTRNGAWFFTDSRYIEAAEQTVQDAQVRMVDGENSYIKLAAEVIRGENIARLGFEDEKMSVAAWESYRKKLPCELVGASSLLDGLRAVKDEEEQKKLVAVQRIAERAFTELMNDIRPGITEREIAARLQYLMMLQGADKESFETHVVSGVNSSMPHGVPTDKKIAAGDFITIDFGARKDGYCSDTTRTVAVGHASDEMREVYDTVLKAQLAGIAAARAGVTGCQVDAAARDVIAAAGYGEYFGHSFGHGLGIEVHEQPYVGPSGKELLPAGAVISAEPGIYLPGKLGVRIEDVLILEAEGCRNITTLPKDLLIL